MNLDITHKFSLSEVGDPTLPGGSNYVKAVFDSKGEKISMLIWVFDT